MDEAVESDSRSDGVAEVVFSAGEIARRIAELGREIDAFYSGCPDSEEVVLIGVLKGTFIFVADLVRAIRRPVRVDFLIASSYGSGTASSGEVRLLYDPATSLDGKHVLLVEDIVDSGTTINRIVPHLLERGARSLELCALLHKRLASKLVLEPRWVGFDTPDAFVVGFGLDWNENYRQLPFIGSIPPPAGG
ncbi:MAG: hypoxanthine phosphoribosyltransferase [Gemmatimonadota bacterium]|jgi:hypoxanthine phosphoribosyltransferase|nr:hypoxanthine phosphoribosyltransferase [Gemmatimonadota bacterium]